MPSIIDPLLIVELAAVIAAVMQTIKSHPRVKGSVIPWLSGIIGGLIGLLWYLCLGELRSKGFLDVDWTDAFRGIFVGIVAAGTANGAYVLQKKLPTPNLLPTSSEMNASAVREEVETNKIVIAAVADGAALEDAKDAVGKAEGDPPPVNPNDKEEVAAG